MGLKNLFNKVASGDIEKILSEYKSTTSKVGRAAKSAHKATYDKSLVEGLLKKLDNRIKAVNKKRLPTEQILVTDPNRARLIGGDIGSVEWFGSNGTTLKNGRVVEGVNALKDEAQALIANSSPEVQGFLNGLLYNIGGSNKAWHKLAAENPELIRSYVRLNNPLYKYAKESTNGLTTVTGTKGSWLNRFNNANEEVIDAIKAKGKKRALVGLHTAVALGGLGGAGYLLMKDPEIEEKIVYVPQEPEPEPEDEYSDDYINSIGLVTSDGTYYDKFGNKTNQRGVNRRGVHEVDTLHDIDNTENYFDANAKAFGLESPEEVAAIQKQLGVRVDGLFGPETERAYRRYLKSIGRFYNGGKITNWINVQ